jgi:DNA-binding transcriptional LysR family regulator
MIEHGGPNPLPTLFRNRLHMTNFVTLADSGSLGAAAQVLGSNKQWLSQMIHRYEETVGVTLFVRDRNKGSYPTLLGSVAVEQARLVLKSMEDADRTFDQARDALNMLGPGKW